MDFPPLDDARWDRLLGAVVDQRPTVGDPAAPLASPFPAPRPVRRNDGDDRGDARGDAPGNEASGDVTIRLDSYA